jgi:hypothetical protein
LAHLEIFVGNISLYRLYPIDSGQVFEASNSLRTNIVNYLMPFQLNSSYQPSGDQPQAIEKLVANLSKGVAKQTLLGVTGSGKTFTVANVIKEYNLYNLTNDFFLDYNDNDISKTKNINPNDLIIAMDNLINEDELDTRQIKSLFKKILLK